MNINLSQTELGLIANALAMAALQKEKDTRLFRDAGFSQQEALSHSDYVVYEQLAMAMRQKGL